MRKPTAMELRLGIFLGAALFILANLVALKWYSGKRQLEEAQLSALRHTLAEYRDLLAERPRWKARKQWLDAHPLDFHKGQESNTGFVEEIQSIVSANGLTIEAQQLKDSAREGDLVEVQFEFNARGKLEQIIRWMVAVQKPGNHTVIRGFTLRHQEDEETMQAKVRIGKIFRAANVGLTQ